jgi:hypothetical protein
MAAPRNSRGIYLAKLKKNISTDLYEIAINGIHYAMPYELMVSLKQCRCNIDEWYSKLKNSDKKRVIRTGDNIKEVQTDFFPDIEPEY